MEQVPSWVYYTIGFIIVTNLSTIGAIIWASLKAAWWLSKLDSRVDKNTADINASHQKHRDHFDEYHRNN